jgi:hypothetical protein
MIGGGTIISVESLDNELAQQLDMISGIDALQVVDGMLRGLATRVQYGTPWASFTLRHKRTSGARTELAKRLDAIRQQEEGYIMPAYHVQAYISSKTDGQLYHVCAARTIDILETYISGIEGVDYMHRINKSDDTIFAAIWWPRMIARGYTVYHWTANGVQLRHE